MFWYWLQVMSAVTGMLVSFYLLVQHTRLKIGIQGGKSFCSVNRYMDCDVVNASSLSEIFGMPLAGYGAIFFFALLVVGLLAPPKDPRFRRTQCLVGWLATFGVAGDAILFGVQVFSIKSLCIVCGLVYVSTALHLAANLVMGDKTLGRGWLRLKKTLTWEGGKLKDAFPKTTLILAGLGFVAFAGLVALIPAGIRLQSNTYSNIDTALFQFYDQWKQMPVKVIETHADEAVSGNPAAKVRLVIFSDFQCPHCRRAAFFLNTVLRQVEDRVSMVFKHFPLDSACNPTMQYQMHPYACELARLTECAQKKGKFWDLHDRIFLGFSGEEFEKGKDAVESALSPLMTPGEIRSCLSSERSLHSVQADIRQGVALGIRATPTLFINGKQVTIPLSVETVRTLVDMELKNIAN